MAPMFLYTQHIVTQSAVCMAPDTLPIRERNRERERERREREREDHLEGANFGGDRGKFDLFLLPLILTFAKQPGTGVPAKHAVKRVVNFCVRPSGRGPVTKPGKDARRGRCHPLEAGFWPLWMTPLPRSHITEY